MLMSFHQRQLSVPKMLAIFRLEPTHQKKGIPQRGRRSNQADEKFQL